MDWTNENTLKFVRAYEKHPCLWDPTHHQRINRFRRTEAWHSIKKELGDLCTVDELRRKKESLMASYRLYKTKVMKSDANARYEPCWFAYPSMDAFLGWIYETCPTPSMKTENSCSATENSDRYYQEESDDTIVTDKPKDVKEETNTIHNTEDKYIAAHSSQTKMNWSNENIIKFIKLYRRNSCLWDPSHPDNALVQCRTRAWYAIKKELRTSCTIKELKKKKEVLIGTYRRFKRKELASKSDDPPDWFAYSLIDGFLAPIYKCPRAFVLRIENKDRNTAYSSSDNEDFEKKQNVVNPSALKSEHPLELQAKQAIKDFISYEDDERNDSGDEKLTAHCTETQIDWPSNNVLRYLELFQKNPCLWDPMNPKRKKKRYRNRAWLAIKKNMNDRYTLEELKKKKEILMCTYRRCKKNARKWKSTGCVYQPSWFAYPIMDSFLGSIFDSSKRPMSTENKDCNTDQSSDDDEDMNNLKNTAHNDAEEKQRTISRTETRIDWTKENILQFIDLYQGFPCLWYPMDPDYADRRHRNKAWLTIKKELGDQFTVNELRKRKDILLCTYKRCKKTAMEVESKNCVYDPTWVAFSVMDSFLDSIYETYPVTLLRTEDNDDYSINAGHNDKNVNEIQDLYSSLPIGKEDPLELVTELVTPELNNYETDELNDILCEQRLTEDYTETPMDWSNEKILKFIELLKNNPCLWDQTHVDKKCIVEAWHAIKKEVGDRCTVEELIKKKDSLFAMYRRCKKKLIESESKMSWFAFSAIDGLLGAIYKCQDTKKPQESSMRTEVKEAHTADSSYYQEECDSNANSDPEEVKAEENYVIIVSTPEPQTKNPLELNDRTVNSSKCDAQNDSEDEQSFTADCTQTPINWSNADMVLNFIELYKGQPCLWNPTDPRRRSKKHLADSWRAIKNAMGGGCTVDDLKKKKESLMSMYRSCKKRVVKSEAEEYPFQPSWFAFSAMDDFLGSIYKCSDSSNMKSVFQDQHNTADSSYYQDDSNDSNVDSELDIKKKYGVTTSALKRRSPLDQPVELKMAKYEEADEEDESYLFGKLVTSKLRKVPQDRRDWLMLKINELFYNEIKERNDNSQLS